MAGTELLRAGDGHLMLRCGPRLHHLRLRLMLRVKHGFHRETRAQDCMGSDMNAIVLRDFARGPLRLLAAVDELARVTLMAQSTEGDELLRQFALELGADSHLERQL